MLKPKKIKKLSDKEKKELLRPRTENLSHLVYIQKMRTDGIIQGYHINPNKENKKSNKKEKQIDYTDGKTLADKVDKAYNNKNINKPNSIKAGILKKINKMLDIKEIIKKERMLNRKYDPINKNLEKSFFYASMKGATLDELNGIIRNHFFKNRNKILNLDTSKLPDDIKELIKKFEPINGIAYHIQPTKGGGFVLFWNKNKDIRKMGKQIIDKYKDSAEKHKIVTEYFTQLIEKTMKKLFGDDIFNNIDRIVIPPISENKLDDDKLNNILINAIAKRLAKRYNIKYDELYLGIKSFQSKKLLLHKKIKTNKQKNVKAIEYNYKEHFKENQIDDKPEKVLFLDDIITTGKTNKVITDYLRSKNKKVLPIIIYKNL